MDFIFHSQESLTAIQWILRAVVAYFFLIMAVRLMGRRSISQLRFLDYAMALIIGNIIAHPLSDEHLGLKGSMITMTVLIVLYLMNVFLVLKCQSFRNVLQGRPFPLIKEGQILNKNLSKARISVDILLSELRKQQITDVGHVALALWEPDGQISFFLQPQYQTVTQENLQLPVKVFDFPRTVIKEGKFQRKELLEIGKDEEWLNRKLAKIYQGDLPNILLATIDQSEQLRIILYK